VPQRSEVTKYWKVLKNSQVGCLVSQQWLQCGQQRFTKINLHISLSNFISTIYTHLKNNYKIQFLKIFSNNKIISLVFHKVMKVYPKWFRRSCNDKVFFLTKKAKSRGHNSSKNNWTGLPLHYAHIKQCDLSLYHVSLKFSKGFKETHGRTSAL
jgi:hypothetical protein